MMTMTMTTTRMPLLLLLLLFPILFLAQPIYAKIRIPSTFLTNQQHDNNSNNNNEKEQQQQGEANKGGSNNNNRLSSSIDIDIDIDASGTGTGAGTDDAIIYDESSRDGIHRKDDIHAADVNYDDDYETIFNNWMGYPNKNIIHSNHDDDHKNSHNRDHQRGKGSSTASYLLFASSKSNQLFSIAEQRLKKLILIKNQLEHIVHQLFVFTYKTTNDIIRYKFPVGIVTAYVTTKVLSKFIHKCIQKGRKNKNKMNGEDENNGYDMDVDDDDALDTYRYVLRHTGRALDLDSDDVTSYRYNGGIERVRSRLIRSAFSDTITSTSLLSPTSLMDYTYDDDYDHSDFEQPPYDDNDDEKGGSTLNSSTRMKNEYQEHRRRIVLQRKLIETLNKALTVEFVPGGSHSEYVRKMIPSLSKAEEYANQLGIVLDHPTKKMDTIRGSKGGTGPSTDIDTDMLQLMKIGLQTVEIRVLDSHLRSIRDRLIRTTYRLDRTVRYWKRKVESISSSSSSSSSSTDSSSSTTSVSYGPRRKTFLSKLNRRFWRFFNSSSGAGDGSNNSLLEGDRLRLAFAEAAYNAEIIRLGKVLFLLNERPYEMSDSTLTNALVEQQQNREKQEQEQYRQQLLDKQWEEGLDYSSSSSPREDDYNTEGIDGDDNDDKGPRARVQIHRMVVTMRDKFRKKKPAAENVDDKMKNTGLLVARLARPLSALVSTTLKPSAYLSRLSAKRRKKNLLGRAGKGGSGEKNIRNKFFTFRFNADGRGKFSVQTYDEGSVTIESDTAQNILLRNYEIDQRPWLDSAAKWTLQARGLVVDVISETVQASIHPSSSIGAGAGIGSSSGGISSSTHNYYFNEANPNSRRKNNNNDKNNNSKSPVTELADLESTWRIRQYNNDRHSSGGSSDDDEHGLVTGTSSSGLESRSKTLLSSILPLSSSLPALAASTTNFNLQQRQWYFVYEMSRDINRLRRVGEGKSLKFKWKEVHWIHWLRQWDLMGVPSAALKIAAAAWIHDKSKPYVPKVKFAVGETYVAAIEILTTRFWTPLKDLADELLSRRKGLVTGVSLREEEASLDIMLHDLGLGDGTPSTRYDAIVKATRQYESDMKTGLIWHAMGGRLVRLMLIQMQQLKVSMLDAAETIDVLFQSNRINMQLLAVVPAVGIVFVGAKLFLRSLFHIRSKDLRPIASVHADMTDYLNSLESNVILRMARSPRSSSGLRDTKENSNNYNDNQAITTSVLGEQEKQLGEFALTLYNYLVLLDYSSPQPFSSRQCDAIHRSLTAFLGREGSFTRNNLTVDDQIRLIDLVKDKHRELSKFL
jgi:hypothetical protein